MNIRKLLLIAIAACLISFAVYLPAVNNGFVNWDDDHYVYQNPDMRPLDVSFVKWAFSTMSVSNWHPLTWLSLGLDQTLWGGNPAGYHLTSVILHTLNTLLAALIAGLLFMKALGTLDSRCFFAAALTGIVFGLHPLHVESVAWISERKDVLYAFFFLLSVLLYIGFSSSGASGRRALYYIMSLAVFALSLLSKPMAVTLPLVLLVLDLYPLKRFGAEKGRAGAVIAEKLPFFLLSIIASVITVIAQKKGGSMEAMDYFSLPDRLAVAVNSVGFYLAKVFVPVGLIPYYPLDAGMSPLTFTTLASVLLVLGITIAGLKFWNRAPVLFAGWAYYLISLVPVLGIVQVGGQAAADRYMYLPVLGPLMVMAALGSRLWEKGNRGRYILTALVLSAAVALSALTVKQISIWKDSVTLWTYVSKKHPALALAHYQLGNAYKEKGDMVSAAREWELTVRADPGHSLALNQLGNVYLMSSSFARAKEYYYAAVEADHNNAEAHYNLALVLEKMNEPDRALEHYDIFLDIAPPEYDFLMPSVRKKLHLKELEY